MAGGKLTLALTHQRPPVPPDLIRNASDEEAVRQGCWYDESAAERVRQFFLKFVRHSKGPDAGKPFELLDWQWDEVIRPLFGWKQADGTRRYTKLRLFLPRRNGKTMLAAALALYMLLGDGEEGAECYVIASDIKQAGQLFEYAANSVQKVKAIDDRCWTRRNIKTIEYGYSKLVVLSGEKTGKTGQNASYVCFDELHEQKDDTVFSALSKSGGSRRQPLFAVISTAGEISSGPCKAEFDYALKVQRSEVVDVSLLPCVYAADPEDPWDDLETARKANPSYGVVIPPRYFTDEITQARNEPRREASYRTYNLNQWVGSAKQWLPTNKWAACGLDLKDWPDLSNEECVIGVDFARRYDLCSYVLVWRLDGTYYVRPRFFFPRDLLADRSRSDNFNYAHHLDRPGSSLTACEGDCVDYRYLRECIYAEADKHRVRAVAFDPSGFEEARQELTNQGLSCIEVPQGSWRVIGSASGEFERAVLTGKLRHPNDPILNWNLGNCVPKESPWKDLVRPQKASEGGKIDGIAATIFGIAGWLTEPEVPVYDSLPLLIV